MIEQSWKCWHRCAVITAAAIAVLPAAGTAAASPLTVDECVALDTEKKSLEGSGVLDDLAQSPGLAQYTYSSDRLSRLRHYLDVKEKVLFRCPNLVVLKPTEVEDTDAASPEAAAKAAADAAAKAKGEVEFGPNALKSSK